MYIQNSDTVTVIDITNNELHPFLSVLDIGVMLTDLEGKITYYNPKHAKMDGMNPKEVLGRNILDVYELDVENSLIMRCLRTSRPIIECPVMYKTKNGHIVDSMHDVIPISKDGNIIGAASFIKYFQIVASPPTTNETEVNQLSFDGDTDFCFNDIIGKNSLLLNAVNRARLAALTNSPVLIHGETGTGKELFTQSIHNLSSRKDNRYIAVNCSAIPENLLEGILFGTSRGAFTGALDKPGLFERANGGTIFLDEINSMSQEMQPKLLRVIQEKRVCRLGSHKEIKLDVKIIGSINTTLEKTLLSGEVRSDLLFRLSVVYISLPPLRERKDDLPVLVDFFTKKYSRLLGKNVSGVSSEVLSIFQHHSWPGNIRELENTIEGSMNMIGREALIERWHLVSGLGLMEMFVNEGEKNETGFTKQPSSCRPLPTFNTDQLQSEEDAKRIYVEALSDADGNISDAAIMLGISRQTFYRKIKSLRINIPKKDANTERQKIMHHLKAYDGNISKTAKALGISRQLLRYRMKKMNIDKTQIS
ncbi:sigma 54-interacting transcriptional regulator [Desulforhopalus sp. 52FAK]